MSEINRENSIELLAEAPRCAHRPALGTTAAHQGELSRIANCRLCGRSVALTSTAARSGLCPWSAHPSNAPRAPG